MGREGGRAPVGWSVGTRAGMRGAERARWKRLYRGAPAAWMWEGARLGAQVSSSSLTSAPLSGLASRSRRKSSRMASSSVSSSRTFSRW